jgi:hypothetical protein
VPTWLVSGDLVTAFTIEIEGPETEEEALDAVQMMGSEEIENSASLASTDIRFDYAAKQN